MTRDDIISMYQKANGWSPKGFENTIDDLERFAALVAAQEREACAKEVETIETYEKVEKACFRYAAKRIQIGRAHV